jgi:hypothetical protein
MNFCEDDRKSLLRLVLFSVIGGSLLAYFTCKSCSSSLQYFLIAASLNTLCWFILWGGNSFMGSYVDRKIQWTVNPIKRLIVGIIGTLTYTVIAMILLMESFRFFLPIKFDDSYTETIYVSIAITIVISLFMHGRMFFLSWKKAAMDAERLQKENAVARYESLKNQVNPHFLFNSLNALTNLVYEDQDKAVKFIKQLSEVYRYVLDTRDREVVTIKEEVDFLKSYLFLQKIRFGDNLKTEIQLNSQGMVAPLALQMLIENAIKHNVVSQDDPLSISIKEENGFIRVENNLQRKSKLGEPSSGIGLENIRNRYAFLSDKKVEIAETPTQFSVCLPIL